MDGLLKYLVGFSLVIGATSTASAQYGNSPRGSSSTPSGGYYTGSSAYGSSVSFGHSNEIITNFTTGTFFSGQTTKNGRTVTDINVSGKYLRLINSEFQVGGLAGIHSISGTPSQTLLTALGVVVYNFDTNIKQAFFVEGGLGIYPVLNATTGDYESKFGLYVGGGKRFPIWERVSYIPSLSFVKKGELDFAFDVQFLNFSIMF